MVLYFQGSKKCIGIGKMKNMSVFADTAHFKLTWLQTSMPLIEINIFEPQLSFTKRNKIGITLH